MNLSLNKGPTLLYFLLSKIKYILPSFAIIVGAIDEIGHLNGSILFTLNGTSKETMLSQSINACAPIDFILFIDIPEKSVIALQPAKAYVPTFSIPFAKDNDWQLRFEAEFEYDETEDQLMCIQDVKDDMESPAVMDRLICGDVGYGKTEIAISRTIEA